MFFELREYRTKPGQRDNWVNYMEAVIIPFQVAKGMLIVGSFVDKEDNNSYIWIRRFDSEEQRQRQYQAVYESDYWQNTIDPQIAQMLDTDYCVIRQLEATPGSRLQ